MSVLDRLATALGRNDERPNVELAEDLAVSGDAAAIAELAQAIGAAPLAVANDALKALYELAVRRPELVAPHLDRAWPLLQSHNNRSVWGALQLIAALTAGQPEEVVKNLDVVIAAADKGSVIAKDKAIEILVALAKAGHGRRTLPILLARLEDAAANQFPSYAEAIGGVATGAAREQLADIITGRLPNVAGAAKRTRLEKLLRKLSQ